MQTGHSFGGHALDRYTFDFETVADADVGVVEAGADPASEAGLSSEQAVSPAEPSAEPAAPAWTDPAYQAAVQEAVDQRLAQWFEQTSQAQQQETAEELNLDPFDPNFGQSLAQLIGQAMQQAQAPLLPFVQSQQLQEARGIVSHTLDSFTDLGLDSYSSEGQEAKQLAEAMAAGFLNEATAAYGPGQRAAQIALRMGAEQLVAFGKAQREAGKNAYIEELKTLSNAPSEPGAESSGVETTGEYPDELAAARGWATRNIA